jgi:hypothetical protein
MQKEEKWQFSVLHAHDGVNLEPGWEVKQEADL